MNIIYISSVCSDTLFNKLVLSGDIIKMPQAQKYHSLLINGLQRQENCKVIAISAIPITKKKGGKIFFHTNSEKNNDIEYHYPYFVLLPFLKQLFLFINTLKLILKYRDKDSIIICDVLNTFGCYAVAFSNILMKNKVLGIVTDIPGLSTNAREKLLPKWKQTILKIMLPLKKGALYIPDNYLFLTNAMNEIVNPKNKPFLVIEGHADEKMKFIDNDINQKKYPKVIMYAGGTHKEFGLELLVKSFLNTKNKEWELHIYGDGNYQNELKLLSKKYQNLKYFGLRSNNEVVDAQIKATLLVNPRLSNAEYVKYSFPSKTLECMASGTPLITTRLSGIPNDYYPYIYLFGEENIESFTNVLNTLFNNPIDQLHLKGTSAKEFAIKTKNNVAQAKKIIDFLKTLS